MDVIFNAGLAGVPVYKDYLVLVPNGSPQQNMWLALHPNPSSKPNYYDAILNGVEIFKVNGTNGNLAGPNPIPAPKQDVIDPTRARPSSGHGKTKNQKAIIIGVITGGIVLAFVVGYFVVAFYRCQYGKDSSAREVPSRWHQEHGHGKDSSASGVPSRWHKNMDEDLPRTFVDASHLLRSRLPPRTSMRLYSLGLEVLVKFTREKLTVEQPK